MSSDLGFGGRVARMLLEGLSRPVCGEIITDS